MPFSKFLTYLLFSTAATIALFFLFHAFLPLTQHLEILWWSIACYVLLAFIIHFLVERSLRLKAGRNMIGLVIFNVFLKLIFTFGFVSLYVKFKTPEDKLFLVPLLLTYLVFTIFETWFLNIQAREVR